MSLGLIFCWTVAIAQAQGVLTQRGDNSRSGVQSAEKILTHESVAKHFGKLFELPVDGQVYAQPLYVPEVLVRGEKRNLLLVATMGNSIYAFDASIGGAPLWRLRLARHSSDPHAGPAVEGFQGILSTPVVDLARGAVFAVSMDILRHHAVYRLLKIDLASGRLLKQKRITGHLPGRGPDARIINGESQIVFSPDRQLQRAGLLLHEDHVHVSFGAVGIAKPYHGWIFSYQADDLQGGPSFLTTPIETKHGGGGIWQSGEGPSVDDQGFVYVATGNGDFSAEQGNYGDSVIKLRFDPPLGRFRVVDYFTPFNQQELADLDWDMGSGGALFIPPSFILASGKPGKFYLLNRDHLGQHTPERHFDAGALQVFQVTEPSWQKILNNTIMWNIHGTPVQWRGQVYVMGESDPVKAFRMNPLSGRFDETPFTKSLFTAPIGMPGGFVALSANAQAPAGTEILWVSHHLEGDATFEIRPGLLHALDANDLSHELWNSGLKREDELGDFAKFVHPTIADGRVYMATFSKKIVVYGLRK